MVMFFLHIPFLVNHTINATPPERLQHIPSFLQRTAPIARFLCEGWTRHDLHILVTAPFCCDRKSWGAYAQSFASWQQATIEFTCHDHSLRTLVVAFNRSQVNIGSASTPRSLFYCLFAPHMYGVVLHSHPVCGESHIQCNTTREVATSLMSNYCICNHIHNVVNVA